MRSFTFPYHANLIRNCKNLLHPRSAISNMPENIVIYILNSTLGDEKKKNKFKQAKIHLKTLTLRHIQLMMTGFVTSMKSKFGKRIETKNVKLFTPSD